MREKRIEAFALRLVAGRNCGVQGIGAGVPRGGVHLAKRLRDADIVGRERGGIGMSGHGRRLARAAGRASAV